MAFIVCLSVTRGQTATDSSVRARIKFLAGNYATVSSMPPMGSMKKGVEGKGTSVVSWTLDSLFLSIEEENANALFGKIKEHGMLGFDSQIHQYVLSMFNNFGDHPVYHGNFAGDTLVLQTTIPAPKGSFDQQIRWYKDGDTVKMKVLNDTGKGFHPILEQTSTPISQPAK